MTPRPVAVTGALGKLGRWVVAELRAHDIPVIAVDRHVGMPDAPAADAAGAPITVRVADLTDGAQADAALDGAGALVHLAAITDPVSRPVHEMYATNVLATFHLLEAAARRRLDPVVLASSQSALGHPWAPGPLPLDYVPVDEAHPARPVDPYALSKLANEQAGDYATRAHGMRVMAMRFPSIWLPDHFPWRPGVRFTERAQASRSHWAYVDVRDAARAIRLALATSWTGFQLLNITSRWAVGDQPVAALLAEFYPGTTDVRVPLGPETAVFDWRRAARVIGFRARWKWRPEGVIDVGEDPATDG